MTTEQIEETAKANHYVNNLVSMKRIFGPRASIGCVTGEGCSTTQCSTVADLVRIGWVEQGSPLLELDNFLPTLPTIYDDLRAARKIV